MKYRRYLDQRGLLTRPARQRKGSMVGGGCPDEPVLSAMAGLCRSVLVRPTRPGGRRRSSPSVPGSRCGTLNSPSIRPVIMSTPGFARRVDTPVLRLNHNGNAFRLQHIFDGVGNLGGELSRICSRFA